MKEAIFERTLSVDVSSVLLVTELLVAEEFDRVILELEADNTGVADEIVADTFNEDEGVSCEQK